MKRVCEMAYARKRDWVVYPEQLPSEVGVSADISTRCTCPAREANIRGSSYSGTCVDDDS